MSKSKQDFSEQIIVDEWENFERAIKQLQPERLQFFVSFTGLAQESEILPDAFSSLEQEHKLPKFIGDISCLNNACSPYLQCAVNPIGDCSNCSQYSRRDINS